MRTAKTIPIRNIYYLLSYAWRRLEEAELLAVGVDDTTELVDLCGRVLLSGVRNLRRRGLDRGYRSLEVRGATVRGRIDVGRTVREDLLRHGRVCCEYDELSLDVPHNRILKAAIAALLRDPTLDSELGRDLVACLPWFGEVQCVQLVPSAFRSVQIHRNNAVYAFLMDVCRLIMERLLASEDAGGNLFRDFLRDDSAMRRLFEDFVRGFFEYELDDVVVGARRIAWSGEALDDVSRSALPGMLTDVTIEWSDKALVLDTKYTPHAMVMPPHGDSLKLRTGHLYQIYAYLRNVEAWGGKWVGCRGMLLYPCVGQKLDLRYRLGGHDVSIRSLDLAEPWAAVREELLGIVAA